MQATDPWEGDDLSGRLRRSLHPSTAGRVLPACEMRAIFEVVANILRGAPHRIFDAYLGIEHAGAGQPGGFLFVSLADKVHNLRSIVYDRSQIGDEIWERFQEGKKGSFWYFESLYRVFKERIGETHRALVDEMGKLIKEVSGLAESR